MITDSWEVQTIRDVADFEGVRAEWNEFYRVTPAICGLHAMRYLEAVCQYEGCTPLVILVRRNGTLKAIAPFVQCSSRIPLRLSLLKLGSVALPRIRLVGEDYSIAPDADAREVFRLSLLELQRLSAATLIEFQEVPVDGRLWTWLSSGHFEGSRWRLTPPSYPQTCHTIHFPGSFDEYLAELSSRDRTNLRRRQRKLVDAFHNDVQLVRVTGKDQIATFLSALDTIGPNTWQAQVYGHRPRQTDRESDFLNVLADLGWLRSYVLLGGQQPIAFQFGIQYNGRYDFLETGYDSQWASLGPGTVLEFLVLADLLSTDRPNCGDFGFGDAEYKRILGNATHKEFQHVYLVHGWALKPNMVFLGRRVLDATEIAARRVLRATKADGVVRRLLRRQKKPESP